MDWKTMLSSSCPKTQTIAACWSRWIQPAMATTNKVKGWLCPSGQNTRTPSGSVPWCINTGKSLIPLTLLFFAPKRNLLIPLELSRVMHQGNVEEGQS